MGYSLWGHKESDMGEHTHTHIYIYTFSSVQSNVCVRVCAHPCLTFCDLTDCSPPGSSLHGIFQARILEWVVVFFSRESSQPRGQTQVSYVSCIGRRILYPCPTWEAHALLSSKDSPCPLECYAMTETSGLMPDGSVWHGLAMRPSPAAIPLLTLPQ